MDDGKPAIVLANPTAVGKEAEAGVRHRHHTTPHINHTTCHHSGTNYNNPFFFPFNWQKGGINYYSTPATTGYSALSSFPV